MSENQQTRPRNHYGYKHKSLICDKIPFKKCVPDTLHLRLRIASVLIRLLINQLCKLDLYDGVDIINSNHKNLSEWFSFVKNKCKIGVKLFKFNKDNCA